MSLKDGFADRGWRSMDRIADSGGKRLRTVAAEVSSDGVRIDDVDRVPVDGSRYAGRFPVLPEAP